MYRKFQKLDELFSNISISFILLLLFGFLNYEKYMAGNLYDIDSWLFFVLMVVCFGFTVFNIIRFLLAQRHPKIDIELDFKRKEIKLRDNQKVYAFSDISLFGYNAKKRDSRFYLAGRLFGVLNENLVNKNNDKVTGEQMESIGKDTHRVKHQHLYNYPITVLVLLMIMFFVFAFAYNDVSVFSLLVICTYIFAAIVGFYLSLLLINFLRLKKLVKKQLDMTELSDLEEVEKESKIDKENTE